MSSKEVEQRVLRSFKGKRPKLHPTSFVSEFCYIVGDVDIEEGSSVWPGVTMRADSGPIRIGKGTRIQENSVVHADIDGVTIGDSVNVGHGVIIHCRKIGDHCLIANNSTLLSRAEVGDYSVVASNAVLREDTIVPPYSFVSGIPGTIRPLTAEQRARRLSGQDPNRSSPYGDRAQEFKEEGLDIRSRKAGRRRGTPRGESD